MTTMVELAAWAGVIWIMLSMIWMCLLSVGLSGLKEYVQEAKKLQDKVNEKILQFVEEAEKGIEKLEDRLSKIEKDKG